MIHPPDMDRLLDRFPTYAAQVCEALVEGYRAGLYRLAYGMLGDADEAEDAVQQTFINAVKHLENYQRDSNFKAWLYTIAVNACRGALRKRGARRTLVNFMALIQTHAGEPGGPEQVVAADETSRQLWAAVAGLAEKQRLVILLRFQQELTIAEISGVLSLPEKTVYSRLYAALRLLRQTLPGRDPDGETEAARLTEMVL